MSNQPLDYRPLTPRGPSPNRWWMVLLRILAGIPAGVGSCIAGIYLATSTQIAYLAVLPLLVVLGVAIFVAIKFRRFGYVTGLVLAPFILTAGCFILLLIICGKGLTR